MRWTVGSPLPEGERAIRKSQLLSTLHAVVICFPYEDTNRLLLLLLLSLRGEGEWVNGVTD